MARLYDKQRTTVRLCNCNKDGTSSGVPSLYGANCVSQLGAPTNLCSCADEPMFMCRCLYVTARVPTRHLSDPTKGDSRSVG